GTAETLGEAVRAATAVRVALAAHPPKAHRAVASAATAETVDSSAAMVVWAAAETQARHKTAPRSAAQAATAVRQVRVAVTAARVATRRPRRATPSAAS